MLKKIIIFKFLFQSISKRVKLMNKQGRLTSKFRVAYLATIQHYLRKISTRAFFSCVAYVFYSNLFEISTYIGTQPNCGRQSLVMCCCIFTVKVPFYRLSLTDESYTLAKKRKKHFANCTDKEATTRLPTLEKAMAFHHMF